MNGETSQTAKRTRITVMVVPRYLSACVWVFIRLYFTLSLRK
jgi:hypothetical protein